MSTITFIILQILVKSKGGQIALLSFEDLFRVTPYTE